MAFDTDDYRFMGRALELARRGLFTARPNPRVGCVLVKEGVIIAEGWHQRAGQPHAEINALVAAQDQARGSTLYVTLEPCGHHGKTPPCTDALIGAGVSRVVMAMLDPNPIVAGQGRQTLTAAGIATDCGLLETEAERLNPGHCMRMTRQRPFIRLKMAMSLDGRTALANGVSQWISGKDARDDVQRLRAQSDAIMTGIGTVLKDDPALNVRLESSHLEPIDTDLQPLRIILDSECRLPEQAKLLKLPGDVLLVTAVSDPAIIETKLAQLRQYKENIEIIMRPEDPQGRPDLQALMHILATGEINELLVECGPRLAGSLLDAGLIDELVCYVAPHILGNSAQGLFDIAERVSMEQRIKLHIKELRRVGDDYRICATPIFSPGGSGQSGAS